MRVIDTRLSEQTYPEERSLHIVLHKVVEVLHDLDEALESCHLNVGVWSLSGLADDLHDIIPFAL